MNQTEVSARYWSKQKDGRIKCELCPRYCSLADGQRGLCYVRVRYNDQMYLDTYGRSSGFCIDPIEKKPLNHFYPGTPVLSFGTAGCNLTCKFCQNHEISKSRKIDKLTSIAMPKELVQAAIDHNCKSIAYTYNDPVIFLEYAVDVAKIAREHQIKNVAVTAGYICEEPRVEFFKYMDSANIDLKGFTDKFYKELTTSSLDNILETIEYVANETNVWIELTCLLIPGENDSNKEIQRMSEWIFDKIGSDIPLHFTAFHPDYKMLDLPRTPTQTLLRARQIALASGLKFVYVGNVHHEVGQSTYCTGCNAQIIGRDWHQLSQWHLDDHGACLNCGTQLSGVFDGQPGIWGRKRQQVKIPKTN
jgi:pyruvate formate lyase activating enzyme